MLKVPFADFKIKSGYVFELEGKGYWRSAKSEMWDTAIYTATGDEVRAGTRLIDDVFCVVFKCRDGKFRAVVAV